jgi:hypothetical protein
MRTEQFLQLNEAVPVSVLLDSICTFLKIIIKYFIYLPCTTRDKPIHNVVFFITSSKVCGVITPIP